MSAPDTIRDLVERFERNREQYRAGKYNETQLRREFLDPFFEALGWDIFNKQGYAETYKDVIHEDSLEIEGATKAPDYAFRVGGQRKFFVEAKKPSVNIEQNIYPAFQLRRYAWSAKLPLGILSDFEEFAVYDCRVKPDKGDKASVGRVMLLSYKDYVEKWDEIVAIFSRDAVLKGSFDSYAEGMKNKKGTTEVDDAFLGEIERWRDLLAKNIALRNQSLSVRELNYAVQMTIDRIVFLRICEDRGVERDEQLKEIASGDEIYKGLVQLFQRADARYNSGLFHFTAEKNESSPADSLTLGLTVDDRVLRDILLNLYYPDSPYVFREIPSDILGQVYERFLGKVIRLTAGHQAKVEEKPEVRKAGGVYYTPTYIVNYIVQNTVGKLLEGKTPKDAEKLRILDPACGSGTFPLGAYQYLLDWHLAWYINHDPEKIASGRNPAIFQSKDGWLLTTSKKKEILLNNIYGVDIDAQAVEVTKLSLLLKVLEGESQETIGSQLSLLQERVLPDLSKNIQCGNSLIGPDYYEGHQLTLGFGDDEERYRVNAFDWKGAFSQVFIHGGFDAVIGNPPYGASLSADDLKYLKSKYVGMSHSWDTYELFLVHGSNILSQSGGLGMIIPASWLTGESYRESRHKLVTTLFPVKAYAMPFDVFEAAYIDTAIVIFSRTTSDNIALIHFFPKKEKLTSIPDNIGTQVDVKNIRDDELNRLTIVLSEKSAPLLAKLKSTSLVFGDWFEIQRGVQPYSRSKHTEAQIKSKFLHASKQLSSDYMPELQGNELSRYWTSSERKSFLRYSNEIASTRALKMFQGQRLVIRRLLTRKFRLQVSTVSETLITTDNVLNAIPANNQVNVYFALGILNSRLISWLYVNTSMIAQKDDFPQVHISALKSMPIPIFDQSSQSRMVSLVERMLKLHKQPDARTPQEQEMVKREIESTDRAIDKLVYELYGLTEEEIKIVEGK